VMFQFLHLCYALHSLRIPAKIEKMDDLGSLVSFIIAPVTLSILPPAPSRVFCEGVGLILNIKFTQFKNSSKKFIDSKNPIQNQQYPSPYTTNLASLQYIIMHSLLSFYKFYFLAHKIFH